MKKILVLMTVAAMASMEVQSSEICSYDSPTQSLHCKTRTLLETGLVSETELKQSKVLKIHCSDMFFMDSDLQQNHFGNLPSLVELQIEHCKVRKVPSLAFIGLKNLEKLSVQSHNADWSTIVMEMESDALKELKNLKEMNFAMNNVWTVPKGMLCHLQKLQSLNMSRNQLLELLDLGVAQCPLLSSLEVLDLSHNQIASIQDNDLSQMPNLVELNLSNNRLTIIGDKVFQSLAKLRHLHLGSNQLTALPPTTFASSGLLQELDLHNNSLTLIPAGLFNGLIGLKSLNLSQNAISSVHLLQGDSFQGLESVETLDLSRNKLTDLSRDTFKKLKGLKVLNLEANAIRIVEASSFGHQKLLRNLILSNNKIEDLPELVFNGAGELRSLALDHNRVVSLHDNIFRLCPRLEDLSLDNNLLEFVPKSIGSHLHRLRTLDLGENHISKLSESSSFNGDFNALKNLYGLRLAGNRLVRIGSSDFANNTGLHVLNLARNDLTEIDTTAFTQLKNLKALRLDNNKLTDINGVLTHLTNLQWLNVSTNQLLWFDFAFVPLSLEWLDLHDNVIEELGNFYKLKEGFNLKTIDASENKIRKISKIGFPDGLETILLNKNEIEVVEEMVFADIKQLKLVDMSSNLISHLRLPSLFIGDSRKGNQPDFRLKDNPFSCDCDMDWLKDINSISLNGNHARVSDLTSITCHRSNQTEELVTSMKPSQFLCNYKTHCFSQCLCCDFFACDCRMQCPDGCLCQHDNNWSANIIDCGGKSHKTVPLLIPMDATEIRLQGNNLGAVDTQSFIGRKRVHSLFLNSSQVTSVSKETFSGLSGLEALYLQDNMIKELLGHEFTSLVSLRELYLQNNDLIHINSQAFEPLASLSILRLDGNLLTTFEVWHVAANNPFLTSVHIAQNMWSCDCEFMSKFQPFLASHQDVFADVGSVMCMSASLLESSIDLTLNGNKSCVDSENRALVHQSNGTEIGQNNLMPIIVSAVLAMVALIIGFLVVCVFRSKIKKWLYHKSSEIYESRSGSSVHSTGSCYGQNRLFDVYISYSAKDADFVDQSLAPTLEHGATSYKLCLHQRDFPPSASLYDTVSVATESSSRVILVLSKSYLETEWHHVKIPLRNALGKDGQSKVILLFVEELGEEDKISQEYPELRQYTKTCASVRWGSAGFLNKLRFFLPEPAFLTFQRNVTLRTLQPTLLKSSNSINQVDQVSGVWTYSLKSHQHLSPNSSMVTTTTTDDPRIKYSSVAVPHDAPSVISSLYSHHTYQSIPEHHIYHTLEPNLLLQRDQQQNPYRSSPVSSVYINRNLDLVLKSDEEGFKKENTQVSHQSQPSTLSAQHLLQDTSSSETSHQCPDSGAESGGAFTQDPDQADEYIV